MPVISLLRCTNIAAVTFYFFPCTFAIDDIVIYAAGRKVHGSYSCVAYAIAFTALLYRAPVAHNLLLIPSLGRGEKRVLMSMRGAAEVA